MADRLRDAAVPEEHADAIIGHAGGGGVGRDYGKGLPLARLAASVAKVTMPGLDLSALYLRPAP